MSITATSRIHYVPEGTLVVGLPRSGVWPLPRLNGLSPCIVLSAGNSPAGSEDVEIGYPDRASSSSHIPVIAAQDGIIAYAGSATGSSTLCIDHAGGWSTQYSDLERLLVRPTDRFRRRRKERVRADDIIGHAPRSLRIRFAVSRLTDDECVVVNPGAWMHTWSMVPWFDVAPTSRSLAEAFLGADDNKARHEAGEIPMAQAPVHTRTFVPSSVASHRTEASGATLPTVALRPTGDGTALAHVLARVLVRRALVQEGAIGVVDDARTRRQRDNVHMFGYARRAPRSESR